MVSLKAPLSEDEIKSFQAQLHRANTADEIAEILRKNFGVTQEHIDFLKQDRGAPKLREFFYEVLLFDLRYGTNTSTFIPEEFYATLAKENPNALAAPTKAEHGVKHRSSLTTVIREGFGRVSNTIRNRGLVPSNATLFDLGCGEGKALMIGMSEEFGFNFKRAVGVDYYDAVLDTARENIKKAKLNLKGGQTPDGEDKIKFVFADAAEFTSFNGTNIVYMYNPFDEEIIREVEFNLRRCGGTVFLIYNKPEHEDIFTNNGWELEHKSHDQDPDKRVSYLVWTPQGPQ